MGNADLNADVKQSRSAYIGAPDLEWIFCFFLLFVENNSLGFIQPHFYQSSIISLHIFLHPPLSQQFPACLAIQIVCPLQYFQVSLLLWSLKAE